MVLHGNGCQNWVLNDFLCARPHKKQGFGHNSVKKAIFSHVILGIESLHHKLSIDGLTCE